MLEPRYMEIHMMILQHRLEDLLSQVNVCRNKVTHKENDKEGLVKDIDIETEKLKEKKLDKQYMALKKELDAYEDEVLALTANPNA